MKKWFLILGILLLLCIGLSCGLLFLTTWKFTPNELENIDRIEVNVLIPEEDDGRKILKTHLLKVIDDPKQIQLIVNKVRTYSDEWQVGEFGALSPLRGPLQIAFFRNGKQQVIFEIGYNQTSSYIKRPWGPGRYLEKKEFDDIVDTLDVDSQFAYDRSD